MSIYAMGPGNAMLSLAIEEDRRQRQVQDEANIMAHTWWSVLRVANAMVADERWLPADADVAIRTAIETISQELELEPAVVAMVAVRSAGLAYRHGQVTTSVERKERA